MEIVSKPLPTLEELGFIEPAALAALIDAKPPTLANWRAQGKGPPFTKVHGNKIVYPMTGVKQWLQSRTVQQPCASTLATGRKRKFTAV